MELCLAGLLPHTLSFSTWPALAEPFTVYTEVFDALAEGIMELAVMQLETEKEIYVQPHWFVSFGSRAYIPPGMAGAMHLPVPRRSC